MLFTKTVKLGKLKGTTVASYIKVSIVEGQVKT